LFIINEQGIILNMLGRRTQPLDAYKGMLDRWFPGAELRFDTGPDLGRDGLLLWRAAGRQHRYLLLEKCHFKHLDAAVVANQVVRDAGRPGPNAGERVLLLAPHIRPQQAAILEQAGIDYVDLAGNAHLDVAGRLVHVEGKKPPKTPVLAPVRPQKGWIKTVMALLIEPALVAAPLRTVAARADVALGTVAACLKDLTLRGVALERKTGREIVDRGGLLAVWVPAFVEGLRPRLAERRLQLRDGDKVQMWDRLQTTLAERRQPWALTGADAAERRDHFFRAAETEIYAPVHLFDDRELQRALVAQPAAMAGNLIVIEPPGPLAVPAPRPGDVPAAPDLLAYAELRYRGTEQALEAAELLLPGLDAAR
jgi:hypothetical protein